MCRDSSGMDNQVEFAQASSNVHLRREKVHAFHRQNQPCFSLCVPACLKARCCFSDLFSELHHTQYGSCADQQSCTVVYEPQSDTGTRLIWKHKRALWEDAAACSSNRSPPPRSHLPGLEKPGKRVSDPLGPGIFWETPGGRGRLCTAPLDRPCGSFCPRRADEKKRVRTLCTALFFPCIVDFCTRHLFFWEFEEPPPESLLKMKSFTQELLILCVCVRVCVQITSSMLPHFSPSRLTLQLQNSLRLASALSSSSIASVCCSVCCLYQETHTCAILPR